MKEVDMNYVLQAYGFLININQEISSQEFAKQIGEYYSLNCWHNKIVYDFLMNLDKTIKRTYNSYQVY